MIVDVQKGLAIMAAAQEERFYEQPLFLWIMLFLVPPIGILVLWLQKHYNFIIRVILSMIFLTIIKINLLISFSFVTALLIGFLYWQNSTVLRDERKKQVEQDTEEALVKSETIVEPVEEKLPVQVIDIDKVDQMGPNEFEYFVAYLFNEMGYSSLKNIRDTHDDGIDVFLEKDGLRFGVQVKHYTSKAVPKSAIQEIISGIQGNSLQGGFVVSINGYTKSAIVLAEKTRIQIIDREILITKLTQYQIPIETFKQYHQEAITSKQEQQ